MITLENWYLSYNGIGYVAHGVVYGHTSPHCPDGAEIHTSLIESAEYSDGEIILSTLNSEYHVLVEDIGCEYYNPLRSLRVFERFAENCGLTGCLDEVRAGYAGLEKQLLLERGELCGRLRDNSLFLEFSDDCEFYFRRGLYKSSAGTVEFLPYVSDFDTDGGKLVVILNYLVDYYPYNGGNIEFIRHSQGSLPDGAHLGIIRNSGSAALNIRFSWGKTVIVSPESEIEVSEGMGIDLPLTSSEQDF